MKLNGLPDWTFRIEEISAGCYRLSGMHDLGASIELQGSEPEDLIGRAPEYARQIEEEIAKKRSKNCL
jgi:hypothetical protein